MKSQIPFFFTVFFFPAFILAQPARYLVFNPADLCKYKEGKTIFVGRVISIEKVLNENLPERLKNTSGNPLKYSVSVEKVFNGQMKIKEIKEFFLKKDLEPGLSVNDENIFIYDEINQNDSKFYPNEISQYGSNLSMKLEWSSPLNNYSAEERAIRFSQIESTISRYPKSPPLTGIVFQTDATPKYSSELEIIYGYESRNFKPLSRITIVAKNKKNGRIFRTKTNEKGLFTFDKLDDGDYAVSIVIPKGFEQVFLYEQHKNYEVDVPINKTTCGGPGLKFEIRKIKKQN
jgi:SdrD B-like domain